MPSGVTEDDELEAVSGDDVLGVREAVEITEDGEELDSELDACEREND